MAEPPNSKNKILVIAGGTYISGAERVTLDVIQGLKDAGYKVLCITSGWTDGNFPGFLRKMEVGYKPLKLGWYYMSNLKWSLDSLINYPKSLLKFCRYLKLNKFNLVYTISFRYIILLYPFLKKNIVYHVHDPNSHSRQNNFFLKLADKKVTRYIAVSDFIKKDLIKCGIESNKVEVIHNGTNQTNVQITAKGKDTGLTIGIVGQIIQRKGHEDVIEALRILREQGLLISLIIAGKGDPVFIEEIKKLIEKYALCDYVQWRNFKDNIYEIYEGIDVIVAPTRNDEPFGLIAIEGNMLGIPVIVSRKGGLVEIIIDDYNGFLIESYNPDQLAKKITCFYNDKILIKKLGYNGRKRMLEYFTREIMVNKINKLVEEVVSTQ